MNNPRNIHIPNNMNRGQNPFANLPPGMKPQKTNTAFKILLSLLIGLIPFLICIMMITAKGEPGGDSVYWGSFKQWDFVQTNHENMIQWNYSFMWLLGLGIFIFGIILTYILSKLIPDIHLDCIPMVSAVSLAMFNMFIIPHASAWFFIISIPSFYIIGYIIGGIVMMALSIKAFKSQIEADPDNNPFKEMQEQMKKQNPNMKHHHNKKNSPPPKKKEYKDNPFVDVKSDDEDDDN